jgi:cyclohexyl-isocyanide hydratase
VLWKDKAPVRDIQGLILTPETAFAEFAPPGVLVVPGGWGQEQLMDDEQVLSLIREQAAHATYVFSVCTGALLCGAAGLLKGIRATTSRDYVIGPPSICWNTVARYPSAAGVTAGIDGALRLVSLLRGGRAAQRIQLAMQYAPEPPFASGSPRAAGSARCGARGGPRDRSEPPRNRAARLW